MGYLVATNNVGIGAAIQKIWQDNFAPRIVSDDSGISVGFGRSMIKPADGLTTENAIAVGEIGLTVLTAGENKAFTPVRATIFQVEKGIAGRFIDPTKVRFSQSSGKAAFSEGGSIQEMADALRSGTLKPSQVPAIRLVEKDGVLFTLDNRRLEAFRRAEVNVPYRMATPAEAASEGWKFTTKNGGVSLKIRGE